MRFAGIDVASERHMVAIVDETAAVLVKPMPEPSVTAGGMPPLHAGK